MTELTGAPAAAPPDEPQQRATIAASWLLVHTAAMSAGAVGLLLLGTLSGRYVLAGLLIPLQILLALSWLAALDASGLVVAAVIASGTAVVADLLTATGPLGVRRLAGVVAVALLLALLGALLQQLFARSGYQSLTTSLAATIGAGVLVCCLAVSIALRRSAAGRDIAVVALVATGAAIVSARGVDAVRLRHATDEARRRSALGVVVAGVLALALGALLGAARSALGVGDGVAIAAAAAAIALAADVGLDSARRGLPAEQEADRARAALLPLAVLLPVCAAAPAAYVAGRLLLG
jgi:hypothetical protein